MESGVCERDGEHGAVPGAIRSGLVPRDGARTQELYSSGKGRLYSHVMSIVWWDISVFVCIMQNFRNVFNGCPIFVRAYIFSSRPATFFLCFKLCNPTTFAT